MSGCRQVQFLSRGITVVGNLYSPSPDAPDRKQSALIVGHPETGIKEQAAGTYAKQLAENGFVALAFDAAYQGESGGEPRNLEDPYQRAEDFRSAVTFLSTLDGEVDRQRIGVVGICASGGYSIFAAQTDLRIKTVASVVGMCQGYMTRSSLQVDGNIDKQVLRQQLTFAGEQRISEARGNLPFMVNILDTWEPAKVYYSTPRGQHPKCTNEMLARSVELMSTYDSTAFVDWISPRPLLMITASKAITIEFSKNTIERAKEPKELFVIEGKEHLDLYDDTSESIPKLVEFMNKWLCA